MGHKSLESIFAIELVLLQTNYNLQNMRSLKKYTIKIQANFITTANDMHHKSGGYKSTLILLIFSNEQWNREPSANGCCIETLG